MKFSIVCPIKDEADLIPKTLPSFYAVKPSEVILCLDKPAPKHIVEVIKRVAKACNAENITRIIEVERNPEYEFHQAWVRRKGFLEAQHDRILTTDIDLVINRNVLKAVRLVREDDIGLVSLSKFECPRDLLSFLRLIGKGFLQKFVHKLVKAYTGKEIATTAFTGLYALWRPYWLDSEDEGIKKLVNPKQKLRQGITKAWTLEDFYGTGEDTYLRDCMERKHKLIYLPDIGCIMLTNPLEVHPDVQYSKGVYHALRGRNLIGALTRTIFRFEPHYIRGHFYGKQLLRVLTRKRTSYSLDRARKYWQYSPSSIGRVKITSEELVQASDADVKKFIERSIEYRDEMEGAKVYRNRVSNWINRENIRRILDFGCGLGQDGVYFAKTLRVQVTFADIVLSNIKLTERYSQIWGTPTKSIYIDCDPKEFQFPEIYDMIFANGVLHHTPEAKEIVQNLKRFLKPHGLFICMLYSRKHFEATGARTLEEYAMLSEGVAPIPNPYSDFYDVEKAKKVFGGFKLIETFTTHKGKFGWYVFRKLEDERL